MKQQRVKNKHKSDKENLTLVIYHLCSLPRSRFLDVTQRERCVTSQKKKKRLRGRLPPLLNEKKHHFIILHHIKKRTVLKVRAIQELSFGSRQWCFYLNPNFKVITTSSVLEF